AEQQTQTTALQLLDDVVATGGETAPTKGYLIAGTDGEDARLLSATSAGHLNVADGGGSLTVDGTVTAQLAAGSNNIGDVDVLSVPAPLNVTGGGTEASALRVTIANDSTGVVSVDDGGGSLTVDGSVTVSD